MRQLHTITRQLEILTLTAALFLIGPTSCAHAQTMLAAGSQARRRGPVAVEINLPADLNWKSKAQILDLRRRQVVKHPELLLSAYTPNDAVFGAIEDGRPWWGTAGEAAFGEGQKSIAGPAEESRFILNPFLLVAANSGTAMIWNPARLTQAQINDPSFPYFWQPESLVYYPDRCAAVATYNITAYKTEVAKYSQALKHLGFIRQFSLVAYNARDMGFEYIYLDEGRSRNIQNDNHPRAPVQISQMFHCGGTCGYPGGCNNMSPFMAEIDRCRFIDLPAQAHVCLWKERPASVADSPDFVFFLDFK